MKKIKVTCGEYHLSFLCKKETKVLDLYKFVVNNILKQPCQNSVDASYLLTFSKECDVGSFYLIDANQQGKILFKNVELAPLLEYLKIDYNNVIIDFSGFGGRFDTIDEIKFFTHSNEENHKYTPHIHTEYKNIEASYSLLDGKKIVGECYPSKIEKKISKIILDRQEEFKSFWLDTTNGVWNFELPFEIEIR